MVINAKAQRMDKPQRINRTGSKRHSISTPLRLDLNGEGSVMLEYKATADCNPIYETQVLTYLRLSELKLGLAINFGE
jgi:GxxExxY protein